MQPLQATPPDAAYEAGRFWPAPLIQLNLDFEPGGYVDDLVADGALDAECAKIFRLKLKQIPVLPPDEYLKNSACGRPYVELIVPRTLQLFYASEELAGFARDLGYEGPPFPWNEQRRHCLQSELDAIFAHMYGLSRPDLEWILDAKPPSSSFPSLKQRELRDLGEYRTERLVLRAFDMLEQGVAPDLAVELYE